MKTSSSRRPMDRALSLDTALTQKKLALIPNPSPVKEVRFQEIPDILQRSPLEEAEQAQMWYSASDLYAVRQDSKSTLRALRKAGWNPLVLDEDQFCLRGLEAVQRHGGAKEKKTRTQNIVRGILDEQFHQRQMGITDPKGLQVLASACSKQAKERAISAAKKDEQEVLESLHESSLSHSSTFSMNSKDLSDEETKLDCARGFVGATLYLNDRQNISSYARSA